MPEVLNRRDFPGRLPPNTVLIDRKTKWGNRYVLGVDGDRDEVCDAYIAEKSADPEFVAMAQRELRGRHLMCHCKPRRCHGDWLCSVANA